MSYPQATTPSGAPPRARGTLMRRARGGFTMMEILIVVVIMGILLLVLVPRVGPTTARREVTGATEAFASIFRQARASAVQQRLPVTLSFNAGVASLLVTRAGQLDTVGYPMNFPNDFGITPTVSSATIVVAPTGLVTAGAPFTFTATKRGESRTITVTGAGRIE
jgi:prepilin-type N-terminal cleavage/methylation domain-containing protein